MAVQCDIRGCVAPASERVYVPKFDPTEAKEVVDLCDRHKQIVSKTMARWDITEKGA